MLAARGIAGAALDRLAAKPVERVREVCDVREWGPGAIVRALDEGWGIPDANRHDPAAQHRAAKRAREHAEDDRPVPTLDDDVAPPAPPKPKPKPKPQKPDVKPGEGDAADEALRKRLQAMAEADRVELLIEALVGRNGLQRQYAGKDPIKSRAARSFIIEYEATRQPAEVPP